MKKMVMFLMCVFTLQVNIVYTYDSVKLATALTGLAALAARPVLKSLRSKKETMKNSDKSLYSPDQLVRATFGTFDHNNNTKSEFVFAGIKFKVTKLMLEAVLQELGILGLAFQVKKTADPAANPEVIKKVRATKNGSKKSEEVWALNCQGNVGSIGVQFRVPLSDMITSVCVMATTWLGASLMQYLAENKPIVENIK